jgi:hypothetical protein
MEAALTITAIARRDKPAWVRHAKVSTLSHPEFKRRTNAEILQSNFLNIMI